MADNDSTIAWHRAQLKKHREALRDIEVRRFRFGETAGSKARAEARQLAAELRRKITASERVIAAYEKGVEVQSTVGPVKFRPDDHQLIRPVIIVKGKKTTDMKSKDDYYSVVEIVPGDKLLPDPTAFGCNLGSPT